MQRFLLTALLLLLLGLVASSQSQSCSEKQEEAALAAACASAGASDAGLPVAGRGLLQVAGEELSLASNKAAATQGSWQSLLQGYASRVSGSVLQASHMPAVVSALGIIIIVMCFTAGIAGLVTGRSYASQNPGPAPAKSSKPIGEPQQTSSPAAKQKSQRQQKNPPRGVVQTARPQNAPAPFQYEVQHLCPELVIPEQLQSVFYLNFVVAEPGPCQADVDITNTKGELILKASINRPAPGSFPTDPVVVLKKGTGEGLARCFLRPGKSGPILRLCDMYQEGGASSAMLDVTMGFREAKWTLRVGNPSTATYTVKGQFSDTLTATVYDGNGVELAEADTRSRGRSSVRVQSGVDAGLVLCTFLGMGELMSCSI